MLVLAIRTLPDRYTPITIKVANWDLVIETQNTMQHFAFKSDHHTLAFKDQNTTPKASFIEIGVLLTDLLSTF